MTLQYSRAPRQGCGRVAHRGQRNSEDGADQVQNVPVQVIHKFCFAIETRKSERRLLGNENSTPLRGMSPC